MQKFDPINALGFTVPLFLRLDSPAFTHVAHAAELQLQRLAAKFSKETDLRATFIT